MTTPLTPSIRPLELRSAHQALEARFCTVRDREWVASYGHPEAEVHALHTTVGLADSSGRDRLCLLGPDRVRFLNGQVTNDLKRLSQGQGCYAALVTAKGRMVSDLNIHVLAEELLLDCEPGFGDIVHQRLNAYLIADDVELVPIESHYGMLSVFGPAATTALTPVAPSLPSPGHHVLWSLDGEREVYLMNYPRFGLAGFDLFVPVAALPGFWTLLHTAVTDAGGCAVGWDSLERTRIEAGIPRFGADMDETTLPPEAGIEARAISYSKGCYTGQEIIARLQTYGHVNRRLRGLILNPVTQVLPKPGDKLLTGDREIGHVTSVASSTTLRSNIALGYVRREADHPGTTLTVRSAAGDLSATLVTLPFAANP